MVMNNGRKACETLKAVRKQIADLNDIHYIPSNCTHSGDCLGTCPICEQEREYIEEQLMIKRKAGKALKIMGVAAGLSAITSFQEAIAQESTMMADSIGAKFEWSYMYWQTGATANPAAMNQIDEMAEFIKKSPNDTFLFVGHTDERGSENYKFKLSKVRAEWMRELLIERGAKNIILIGCGSKEPMIPNAKTEPEHEQNSRITLEFYSPNRIKELEEKIQSK